MSAQSDIEAEIDRTAALLKEKLGAGGQDLSRAVARARRRLPRHVRRQAELLARAAPMARHPKLRLTLDRAALSAAASEVQAHLEAIDLKDRRKGWWLGMLGGLAFNFLLAFALAVAFLRWQGLL